MAGDYKSEMLLVHLEKLHSKHFQWLLRNQSAALKKTHTE